ncbi:DsbA family protein [Limnobacter litoralis]|uniref:2-hydroxychromene-2-carboxylate isomerase n=1 Tax=Limnobacter litoralis TaxID=481366 RepID=A0ABQ5YNH2_9BURK|nr:DsbA family protein [Limnobacter litoralis]GLR25071.1 2-hydroxychromene-2-carboxylate isomerase [Limnobacter litoralis]
MNLRTLLMPIMTASMLSEARLQRHWAQAEKARQKKGLAHVIHYFHQVDDPYSALVAQAIPQLMQRYVEVQWQFHLVQAPLQEHAPERDRLMRYSRTDATRLANYWGLKFSDPGRQPDEKSVQLVQGSLVTALEKGLSAFELAAPLSHALWENPSKLSLSDIGIQPASAVQIQKRLHDDTRLRQTLGHYLGTTLYYAGEWYWGIDRLHHLESRLQALHCDSQPGRPPCFPAIVENHALICEPVLREFDFFFSLRSPYSAIVAPRVFAMAQRMGVKVNLRYVLPMVMRGLPVPAAKRKYIVLDTAREARLHHTPFGRISDPVGKPTERGLSLIPLAQAKGVAQAYICSFMKGVWAEGVNAGSDRGLRLIAERAGLSWDDCKQAMTDNQWRAIAEQNREALLGLGLWGVPSFSAGQCAVWGQDRLWWVQQALKDPSTIAIRRVA